MCKRNDFGLCELYGTTGPMGPARSLAPRRILGPVGAQGGGFPGQPWALGPLGSRGTHGSHGSNGIHGTCGTHGIRMEPMGPMGQMGPHRVPWDLMSTRWGRWSHGPRGARWAYGAHGSRKFRRLDVSTTAPTTGSLQLETFSTMLLQCSATTRVQHVSQRRCQRGARTNP